MHDEPPISIEAIRECLEGSLCLMESRLVRTITATDYFVESNVTHKDPRTGKAREIDIKAESAPRTYREGVCVKTTFVIEARNNRYPIVILTEQPSSPNADFDSHLRFGTSTEPCPFLHDVFAGSGLVLLYSLPYGAMGRLDACPSSVFARRPRHQREGSGA